MSSTATSSPPSFSVIGGPPLIGLCFNWALLGLLTVQVYIYHIAFPFDHLGYKTLVYTLYLLDSAQTFLFMTDTFQNLVKDFGRPERFARFNSTWLSLVIITAIVSVAVQSVYARRIWVLSKSSVFGMVIAFLALLQGCSALANGIKLKHAASISSSPGAIRASSVVWLVANTLSNVMIALSMTVLLLKKRPHSRKLESESTLNRLVMFVMETGLVTAVVAVVQLILYVAAPNTLLFECPSIILAKLYSNSLLAGLNNRMTMIRQTGSITKNSEKPSTTTNAVFGTRSVAFTDVQFPSHGSSESGDGEDFLDLGPDEEHVQNHSEQYTQREPKV
ncbi:hypothetical protein C8Q75DRAFT_806418 [Abortiporus biennis]|nr:hypothetical protein C8Q75DRAFT_806418 [Abortiporus biennis]